MGGEARRNRAPPRAADRVDRSHAWRWADDHGFGKRRPRAAGFGEASQGLLPAPLVGGLERDPTVEIDALELNVRRVALRPPGIGQVLLRRVRDGAPSRRTSAAMRSCPRVSVMVCGPVADGAARTRHPDSIVLDATVARG